MACVGGGSTQYTTLTQSGTTNQHSWPLWYNECHYAAHSSRMIGFTTALLPYLYGELSTERMIHSTDNTQNITLALLRVAS